MAKVYSILAELGESLLAKKIFPFKTSSKESQEAKEVIYYISESVEGWI
jgi:hypothetical protein